MTQNVISNDIKDELEQFLKENESPELVNTYLFYVEKKFKLHPVLFPKDKIIYQSAEDAVKYVEKQQQLWHETEIKIGYSNLSVNDQTRKFISALLLAKCSVIIPIQTHKTQSMTGLASVQKIQKESMAYV